jgi:GR25 family glycosyltransferase involved in LPS biosynthesis
MKILYVTPHLSTGGLPQYLTKKIESLIDEHEIHVVEYDNISCDFVVQRNKIEKLLGTNLKTLDQNTHNHLPYYINNIGFDVIHFEEFSESFINGDILKNIYTSDRKYKIFETTHSSHKQEKIFLPDAFIFVSSAHIRMYGHYNIPASIVEYPIDKKQKSQRTEALSKLGLDPNKKHVLNVGLFTPGKNQGEIFEYAKHLPDYQFHFVGNQAGNFQFYWGDLMNNKPDNCVIWGERNDVDLFYDAADLFLFTSKLELSPLVIREALSWDLPILMYDLPIYNNDFDKYGKITYLSNNIDTNISLIKQERLDISKEIVVITAYPDTPAKESLLIQLITNVKSFGYDVMISSHYDVPVYIQSMVAYNVIDLTDNVLYRREFDQYSSSSFYWTSNNNRKIIQALNFNHAYAVWTLWQNAINKLKPTDYKKVHIVDYDCIINDKRYLELHSNILNTHDLIVYSDPQYFISNLFSFNLTEVFHKLFNEYDSKEEFFRNSYGEHILEQLLYKTAVNYNIKYINLDRKEITRFNTQFDLARAEAIKNELSTDHFNINIFKYNDKQDILIVEHSLINFEVDGKTYNPTNHEKLYLIDKKDKHIYSYLYENNGYEATIDMSEHSKYYKIEIYNANILIDENKKDLIVITAHINNDEKAQILDNLVNNLTNMSYDILLTSHHPIPEYITKKVKYVVIDDKNELLYRDDYEKYNIFLQLYNVNSNRKLIKVPLYNHGYAVWTLWKNAINHILYLDYNKIHIVDYDTDISDHEYLKRHSELLLSNDLVTYKSNDFYTDERYVTSLFSFNMDSAADVFNHYVTMDSYFKNEFNTSLLEDVFYKLLMKKNKRVHAFDVQEINSFNTKVNLIVGDNSTTNELSTDKYILNLYTHNEQHDILYLANCNITIFIDDKPFTNPGGEKLYLIPSKAKHKIDDNTDIKYIDMEKHGEFNKIEVYNPNILVCDHELKIRIVHMVTSPDNNDRERESIDNISKFSKAFNNVDYSMQISAPYKELPPVENCAHPDWIAMEPGHQKLSPGHYGCYLAHKNAISIPDNKNYDMVIIFEGDAVITTEYNEFYTNLLRWKQLADQENMNLIGFGNVFFDGQANEIDDLYLNVKTFIPAHAYFVTKNSIQTVIDAYNSTKWNATDLWMTELSGLRKAITKTVHSKQLPGYSLIDKKIKNKYNDLTEIYSE